MKRVYLEVNGVFIERRELEDKYIVRRLRRELEDSIDKV